MPIPEPNPATPIPEPNPATQIPEPRTPRQIHPRRYLSPTRPPHPRPRMSPSPNHPRQQLSPAHLPSPSPNAQPILKHPARPIHHPTPISGSSASPIPAYSGYLFTTRYMTSGNELCQHIQLKLHLLVFAKRNLKNIPRPPLTRRIFCGAQLKCTPI